MAHDIDPCMRAYHVCVRRHERLQRQGTETYIPATSPEVLATYRFGGVPRACQVHTTRLHGAWQVARAQGKPFLRLALMKWSPHNRENGLQHTTMPPSRKGKNSQATKPRRAERPSSRL